MAGKLPPPGRPLPFDELDPNTISLEDQITDALREAAMRRNVYAGWVRAGRLKPDDAAHRYAAMCAIVRTLIKLKETNDGSREDHGQP